MGRYFELYIENHIQFTLNVGLLSYQVCLCLSYGNALTFRGLLGPVEEDSTIY